MSVARVHFWTLIWRLICTFIWATRRARDERTQVAQPGRGKRKRVCVRESPHYRSALATGTRCGIARLIACRTLGPPEE